MAIFKEWMLHVATAVHRNNLKGPVYMLGDTECYFTPEYALKHLKRSGLLTNPAAPISTRGGLLTARSFFAMLNVEPYTDVDINIHADLKLDLSKPLPGHLHGVAAAVVDIGTIEHIFNVAQAFENIVNMIRPDGMVMHISPVSWYNHGFYNFNPLLFEEFYTANDFAAVQSGTILSPFHYPLYFVRNLFSAYSTRTAKGSTPSICINHNRYLPGVIAQCIGLPAHAVHLFVARRGKVLKDIIYPIQGMYAATNVLPQH